MWNFILAIVISYLLMSALFENFFYPFLLMFSVPWPPPAALWAWHGESICCLSGAGHYYHARIRRPRRYRGKQRHPDCPPKYEQYPDHNMSPGRPSPIGPDPYPTDLHEQYHHRLRHASVDPGSREQVPSSTAGLEVCRWAACSFQQCFPYC